jgi:hypothetical protein
VDFYDRLQELSASYLLPLMPFDAICLEFNFKGLFVPGLGVDRYAECASAMMETLPCLLPASSSEIYAKVSSVRVDSKNGYDLLWRVLELTVAGFDPTLPLDQPRWSRDMDILEFGRRYELYFRLQAKRRVHFTSRHRTSIFLHAVASTEYADIVATMQSNINAYRHPDDDNFLPQHFRLTNMASQIHKTAKAWVQDIGHSRVHQVSGWDSRQETFDGDYYHIMHDKDKIAYCHVQGYHPRALAVGVNRDRGLPGRPLDQRGTFRRPDSDNDRRHDRLHPSGDRGPPPPRG